MTELNKLIDWLKEAVDRYLFLQISHPHLAHPCTDEDRAMFAEIQEKLQTQESRRLASYADGYQQGRFDAEMDRIDLTK